MRFFECVKSDGGTLPADQPVQIGSIIRTARINSRKPGSQWSAAEAAWVTPIWRECDDPCGSAS